MATYTYLTGFNHQSVSTSGAIVLPGIFSSSTGTISIDTGTVRSGGCSFKTNAGGAGANGSINLSSGPLTSHVAVCYVNFFALPSASTDIVTLMSNGQAYAGIGYDSSTTSFQAMTSTTSGGAPVLSALSPVVAISNDTWYRLEFKLDASANPWQLTVTISIADSLDVLTSGTATNAVAAINSSTTIYFGNRTVVSSMIAFWTDIGISQTLGDYPIGPISVYGYSPSAVGTHSFDAATSQYFFSDTSAPPGSAGTALTTSETTSYQTIDEIPIASGNDAIKITAPRIGSIQTPTFGSAGTWAFTSNNVNASPTLSPGAPASVAAGDLLLLVSESRSITATATTPTGWNLCTNFPKRSGTASGGTIYLWTRTADGSGNDTPSVSWSGLTSGTSGDATGAGILRFTNLSETQDVTAVSQDLSAQTATSSITGITTATNNSMVINVAMKLNESSGQTSTVTTYTERVDTNTTSGTGHTVTVDTLVKTTAGASGSGTLTWSATTSARVLIATIALKATLAISQPTNTWYAEENFSAIVKPPTTAPTAVRAIVGQELDTATSSTWGAKLFDSVQGTNTEDIINETLSDTTKTFKGKVFNQRPNTGGTWTKAALDGLRIRFGYTASASGNPRLAGAVLEAVFVPAGSKSIIFDSRRVQRNSLLRR